MSEIEQNSTHLANALGLECISLLKAPRHLAPTVKHRDV